MALKRCSGRRNPRTSSLDYTPRSLPSPHFQLTKSIVTRSLMKSQLSPDAREALTDCALLALRISRSAIRLLPILVQRTAAIHESFQNLWGTRAAVTRCSALHDTSPLSRRSVERISSQRIHHTRVSETYGLLLVSRLARRIPS
jgi:hypothetical protein